jgi:thioredoxin 1
MLIQREGAWGLVAYAVAITDASFRSEVYDSVRPVLVDFWAEWCAPCKALAPVLDEVAAETKGQIKIAKLDVDSNPTTVANFGVQSIPTLILFKNGKPAERLVGLRSKEQLMQSLAPHLI